MKKENYFDRKTQVFLQRYDIVKKQLDIVYMGDEFGAEEFPIFGRAEEVATVFGVKMMLFQQDFAGSQLQKSFKVPPQEATKFTEQQFFGD